MAQKRSSIMRPSPLLFTKALWLLAPLAWAASVDDLQALNSKLNAGITYVDYAGWDFRDLGDHGAGNCAAIAYTKWKRLEEQGYGSRAVIRTCSLWSGQAHAFVVVDDQWLLDNITTPVRTASDDGCVDAPITLNLLSLKAWVASHGDHGPLPHVAKP